MQRLLCPHCGPRGLDEWVHGEIFEVPESITDPDARDVDRGYMHNNHAGVVAEAWFHQFGCRRWHTFRRDTRTDTFL